MATSSNVQEEMQVLKDDIAKIRTDLGDLIDQLKELGMQKVNETRDTLGDELDAQREKLRATFNRARERGRGTAEEFEQPRLKGLNANANAIDSGMAVGGKKTIINSARVGLEGNLGLTARGLLLANSIFVELV